MTLSAATGWVVYVEGNCFAGPLHGYLILLNPFTLLWTTPIFYFTTLNLTK